MYGEPEKPKRPPRVRKDRLRNITRVGTMLRLQPDATNREIADKLGLAYATVAKNANLARKTLGIPSRRGPRKRTDQTAQAARLLTLLSEALQIVLDFDSTP